MQQTESVTLIPRGKKKQGKWDCARKPLPDRWITHGLGGRVRKAHSFTFLSQTVKPEKTEFQQNILFRHDTRLLTCQICAPVRIQLCRVAKRQEKRKSLTRL